MRKATITLAIALILALGCDQHTRRQDNQDQKPTAPASAADTQQEEVPKPEVNESAPTAPATVDQPKEAPKPPAVEPVSEQEAKTIAILKSGAPRREKMEACRALALQGGRHAIPTLEALLVDEELSHMARYALEPLPFPEAGEALRNALPKTSGALKVGVISSLAIRRDKLAVPALIALLSSEDGAVAHEAARSLGTIATPEAGGALAKAVAKADGASANGAALCEGLLRYAEALEERGQGDQAAAYDRILDVPSLTAPIRVAALRGSVLSRGAGEGLKVLADALRKDDSDIFDACLRISLEMGRDDKVTAVLVKALPDMTPDRKIRLMNVLSHRGGNAAGAAMLEEAKGGPVEVRTAALRGLTRMGYGPAVKLMTKLAWAEEGELAGVARDSLCYFPGKEGDAAIAAMLADENAKARLVAIEMVGRGGLDKPADLLMKTVRTDPSEDVRIAALKAMYHRASMSEVGQLLDHLVGASSEAEIGATEKALRALCAREKKMAPGNVVIVKAVYGALPDGASKDVTKKVADMVKSGALSVNATNGNFGDPAHGIVKQLRIDYRVSGTPTSKTVQENQTLNLTTASAPPAIVDAFVSAYEKARAKNAPSVPALIRLLGSTESNKAFGAVQTAATHGEGETKATALRVLCDWPTADALPVVMKLAQETTDPTLRMLAFRGAVRMLKLGEGGSAGSTERYKALLGHANRADQKRLLLSGLAQIQDVTALEMVFSMFGDKEVKAEAVQAAVSIAQGLGTNAKEDKSFAQCKDLSQWNATTKYWRFEDGAIVGHSSKNIPETAYIWSNVDVADFYLCVLVKLEPPTANSGVQFRSKKINKAGHALGYQGDIGKDVWGRLYHQGGRGKLDWNGRAEEAVKPGEWNRYEILAVGPAIWTAINGKLGVACLDTRAKDERSGGVAFQIHVGPPQTVRFKIEKLVHNPKVELAGLKADKLISELKIP